MPEPACALPQETLAIFLGASDWPRDAGLAKHQAFRGSREEFRTFLLGAADYALPSDNLCDQFDSEDNPDDQLAALGEFLERHLQKDDPVLRSLLVYYVGHGILHDRDSFVLALRQTSRTSVGTSGLRLSDLLFSLRQKASQLRLFLILDCCYSGAGLQVQTSLAGAVCKFAAGGQPQTIGVLASCAKDEVSLLPAGAESTPFTSELVRVLASGVRDASSGFSLSRLCALTTDSLSRKYGRTAACPQADGALADEPFFPNKAAVPAGEIRVPEPPGLGAGPRPRGNHESLILPTLLASASSVLLLSLADNTSGAASEIWQLVALFAPFAFGGWVGRRCADCSNWAYLAAGLVIGLATALTVLVLSRGNPDIHTSRALLVAAVIYPTLYMLGTRLTNLVRFLRALVPRQVLASHKQLVTAAAVSGIVAAVVVLLLKFAEWLARWISRSQ